MICKHLNIINAAIISVILFSCSDDEKNKDVEYYAKIQVDTAISRIANDVIDLTSPGELFLIHNFTNIYNHPTVYKEDIINYLSVDTISALNKTIAFFLLKK